MKISIKLSSVQSWDSFPTTFPTFDISQDKKASSAENCKSSDNVWCECLSIFWNCSMVSVEADRFMVGRLMMDIYMYIINLTVLDFNDSNCIISTFYHQSVPWLVITYICPKSNTYTKHMIGISATSQMRFQVLTSTWTRFGRPSTPILNMWQKDLQVRTKYVIVLYWSFSWILQQGGVGSKDKICHFVFVYDTKTKIYQIFSLSISLRAP